MWNAFLDGLASFFIYGCWASPVATFTIVWYKLNKPKGAKIIIGVVLSIAVAVLMLFLGVGIGYRRGYTH